MELEELKKQRDEAIKDLELNIAALDLYKEEMINTCNNKAKENQERSNHIQNLTNLILHEECKAAKAEELEYAKSILGKYFYHYSETYKIIEIVKIISCIDCDAYIGLGYNKLYFDKDKLTFISRSPNDKTFDIMVSAFRPIYETVSPKKVGKILNSISIKDLFDDKSYNEVYNNTLKILGEKCE